MSDVFSFGKKTTPMHIAVEEKAYSEEKKRQEKAFEREEKQRALEKGKAKAQKEVNRKRFFATLGSRTKEYAVTGAKTVGRASGKAVVSVAKGIYRASESGGKSVGREERAFLQSRIPRRSNFRRTVRTSYGANDPYNFLLGSPSRRGSASSGGGFGSTNYSDLITGGSSRKSSSMFGMIDPLGFDTPRRTIRRKKKSHKESGQRITLVLGGK